jgi:hypothetical protein
MEIVRVLIPKHAMLNCTLPPICHVVGGSLAKVKLCQKTTTGFQGERDRVSLRRPRNRMTALQLTR